MRVAVFCGGRGSASTIRELMRWPHFHTSLLINAWDDGLSTGALRRYLPTLPGPSDFRKNLARVVDLHSKGQVALQRLFEHRLSQDFGPRDVEAFRRFVRDEGLPSDWEPELQAMFRELDTTTRTRIRRYLRVFVELHELRPQLELGDCSVGNLIFTGAWLLCDQNFNATIRVLAHLLGVQADIVNICNGENRVLVALKQDGTVLRCEAEIVGPQSPVPIRDIFLLERSLDDAQWRALAALPVEEKAAFLGSLDRGVDLSAEAAEVIREADVIVFGPGTQYSSLLPSYRTQGLSRALRESRATHRVFVVNLDTDHDIQSLSGLDLVDRALAMLGDPENQHGTITHILFNSPTTRLPLTRSGEVGDTWRSARIVRGRFENPLQPGVHSGYAVVRALTEVVERGTGGERQPRHLRGHAGPQPGGGAVAPGVLGAAVAGALPQGAPRHQPGRASQLKLPEGMSVEVRDFTRTSDVELLHEWLEHGQGAYLVTLTGDGEYRLQDIFLALQVLKVGAFGAVLGSRTQSRRQFLSSLRAAYGERRLLFTVSWLAAFVFSGLFGLFFRVLFSDPLTGFRLYERGRLTQAFREQLARKRRGAATLVTKLLIRNQIEVAEVPVHYRTFVGFTRSSWRIRRALGHLAGLFR